MTSFDGVSERDEDYDNRLAQWHSERQPFESYVAAHQDLPGGSNDDVFLRTNPGIPKSSMLLSGRSHTVAPSDFSDALLSDASLPSLTTDASSVPSTVFSVSTGLASASSGFPLLDLETGEVVERRLAVLECWATCLGCYFTSYDIDEWKMHCLSHFHPHEPPKTIKCTLCGIKKGPFKSGWDAWDVRMDHMAFVHHRNGYSLSASRPDFALYKFLYNRKILTPEAYHDLTQNGGQRSVVGNYTYDEGPARRRRR